MKATNLIIDDTFRQKDDFLLTLFDTVGLTFDTNQMSSAIGSHSDILLKVEYPENVDRLLQLMDEHGLIHMKQSCETLMQNEISAAS